MNKLVVITLIKNEASYILEFVDYYTKIGVDKIYIYDDESTDNVKNILTPYKNVIYNKIIRRNKNDQTKFINRWGHYEHFKKNYADECDWVLCVDCDEFLTFTSKTNLSIKNMLESYDKLNIHSILINFNNFLPIKNENINSSSIMQFTKSIKIEKDTYDLNYKSLVKVKYIDFDLITNNHCIPIITDKYYSSNCKEIKYINKTLLIPHKNEFKLFFIKTNDQFLKLNHYKFRNWKNKINNYKFNTWNKYYNNKTLKNMLNNKNYKIDNFLKELYIKNKNNKNFDFNL